mmetsp:Transcript_36609/g.64175  ORF Transcript_36609/g.64175 Transcript_36609/m.64175 type:complete len:161 (-) Transcript_36609:208-690(-)
MTMTYSPVVSQVLDDTVYTGLPLSQEGAIFDSSPSLLVPKSNNSTTALLSESFVSYVRYDGLITFVSAVVLGAIGSAIKALLVIFTPRVGPLGYFTLMLLTFTEFLLILLLWVFFKRWHPSALREIFLVGLLAGNVACLVVLLLAFPLLFYSGVKHHPIT